MQADGDKRRVAGIFYCVTKGLTAVPGGFPTGNLPVANHYVAGTFKCIAKGGCVAVKRGGKGNYFENRTRLIWVGNCFVSPLVVLCRFQSIVLLVLGQRLYFRLDSVAHVKIFVRVEVAFGCHRKYLARFCVHYYAGAAFLYAVLFYRKLKVLFDEVLHAIVKGEHYTVAVLGGIQLVIAERHIAAPSILRGNDLAGSAAEHVVVIRFKPICAGVRGVHKSDYRRSEVLVRVFARNIFLQVYCANSVVAGEGGNLFRGSFVNSRFDHLVVCIASAFFANVVLVKVQNLRKPGNYQILLRFILYVKGRNANRPCSGAHGENVIVSVVYVPAGSGNFRYAQLLRSSLALILLRIHYLELKQPYYKCRKADDNDNCRRKKHSSFCGVVR